MSQEQSKIKPVGPNDVKPFGYENHPELVRRPLTFENLVIYINEQLTRESGPEIHPDDRETLELLDCYVINMRQFGTIPEDLRRKIVYAYVGTEWQQVNFAYGSSQLRLFRVCKGGPVWLG